MTRTLIATFALCAAAAERLPCRRQLPVSTRTSPHGILHPLS